MKRNAPEVRQYMSRLPLEAEQCERAGDALDLMCKCHIHHLPIVSGSHLKGVVTRESLLEAKIKLAGAFSQTPLQSLCQSDVITISPIDPIDEVCRQMLARESDHAVVMDGGFVVGIVTAADILRFITEFFGQR